MTEWPGGARFAFTIFDDTDWSTVQNSAPVYDVLTDLGILITKSVWMFDPGPVRSTGGGTCDDPAYLDWVLGLVERGHDVGLHNATDRTSARQRTLSALDRFEELFGVAPRVGADHAGNREALYAGSRRLTGWRRSLHGLATAALQPDRPRFEGENPSSPLFWGDAALERIDYWRRFTWTGPDLRRHSPVVYRDPTTPWVARWFDSCHGPRLGSFLERLDDGAQDRLASSGGVCIMYTHFGVDFVDDRGRPDPRFVRAMTRLAESGGWFAPVADVLDHYRAQHGLTVLDRRQRVRLEQAWIADRVRSGSRFGPRVQTHEGVQARSTASTASSTRRQSIRGEEG